MSRHRGRGRHGAGPQAAADASPQPAPEQPRQPRQPREPRRPKESAQAQEAAPSATQPSPAAQPGGALSSATEPPAVRPAVRRPAASHPAASRPAASRPAARRQSGPRTPAAPTKDTEAPQAESAEAPENGEPKKGCTLAQMRRFIKSRPYVPLHELRRRFEIESVEDEVNPIPTDAGTLFVGLPPKEAGFLGELIKSGEVGYEQLLDPVSPALVGVFPMRPVARQ